jgi:indole-3-glycerol phosphate synthase
LRSLRPLREKFLMSNFLNEIFRLKRQRVERAKTGCDLEEMKEIAESHRRGAKPFALRSTLKASAPLAIIAEIKRASPSKGVIHDRIDPAALAHAYERGGAAAVSVLTEEDRFQGSLDDLSAVRRAVSVPVLRKDFLFDEFQIYEAALAGADACLLIAAMLDDETLKGLLGVIENDLKMDALVEVHTRDELRRAAGMGAGLIGVNNRDLHSFKVSLDVSRDLVRHAPPGALMVAESGLQTREDLAELKALGFRAFLIGETLMRSGDPERILREWTAQD